ncbi:glucosidase 2 subunit beta-like isoform X1 [Pomacea canaliculata]|uniref:glucosidase 2 subunit beta-like isoform X1 n=1 Tax=Pomacea canaliculata TaxID=400727 RepID=UPI000D73079D|nr:glucosidase 2 subunit beta-like isoform X1 [Pomacea canaliculata]
MFLTILCSAFLLFFTEAVERPRGVPLSKASFYQVDQEFKCLTTGQVIPFEYINDNYCDCTDGTDEPGTSACANGFFYCENKGFRGEYITSSRVNDGICDCCDGSDEYGTEEFQENIKCINTCNELGRKEREEREAFQQLQEQGYKIKQEYIQQGKRTKDEKRARLSELEKEQVKLVAAKDELQAKKEQVEAPEKEAKDRHEKAWEEFKAKKQAEKDRLAGIKAFAELDVNSDSAVDIVEMRRHSEFDIDSDGTVSEEEAREYLSDSEKVDLDTFLDRIWSTIKDIYKPPPEAADADMEAKGERESEDLSGSTASPPESPDDIPAPPSPKPVVPPPGPDSPADGFHGDEEMDDEYDDDEEDNDRDFYEEEDEKDKPKTEEELKMPPYDEETQNLIAAADAARNEYNEAENKVRDAENEINGLKKYLEVDYGPDEEFSSLRGQCFEYTDREYTYKLCPFDKAVQKPKSGGSETSLGKWGHWYGPEEDKYVAMKYENGQNCWNGPNRSCHVNLHCGTENKLTGASEPSRCEYQFEFTTPARCQSPDSASPGSHEHTEL